ncbi:hypothetical protein AGMMS49579_04440 [Spirochaetia bacterium]|nr:hypothetical protein AGMMS49579_04440 [Spirochaetia bacterium]
MHNFYNMMFFHKIHHLKRHIDHFFGHGQVLAALLQKGPADQSELLEIVTGERPSVDGMSLGKILSELEKQKLIKRGTPDEDNGRDVFSLTKKGETFAKRLQIHNHLILNMSGSLSGEEKDQLATILEKLRSNTGNEEFPHFHFRGSHFDFRENHHERRRYK